MASGCAFPDCLRKLSGQPRRSPPPSERESTKERTSRLPFFRLLGQSGIMKYLDAAIVGIHDVHLIALIDMQSGRQLELSGPGAPLAEVIQQLPFLVEDLHHAPGAIHHVQMTF